MFIETKGEAMKILAEGKWKNPWSMEIDCSEKECGAKLLLEEGDVRAKDYSRLYSAECPICESSIIIPGNAIPLRVKQPLDKKRKWPSCDG